MSFQAPETHESAAPLAAVSVISLDTETTGLNISEDRVIEMSCVLLEGGALIRDSTYDSLVNPGVKIPRQSSNIHGIYDKDVSQARRFPDVMAECAEFAGPRLVIGYSIGFDMAILKAEHERHSMQWSMPRCLDVAHLVRILNPQLPAQSLEITADWLSVEVKNRHRALGDAITTGDVYLALLPRLRGRGIRTLSQAERACRKLSRRIDEEIDAGWQVSVIDPERQHTRGLARVDSFPYRHQVRDVMSSPVKGISAEKSLKDALTMIVDERLSSLVVYDAEEKMRGILTERDVLSCIRKRGPEHIGKNLEFSFKKKLVTIDSREFVYRALLRMSDNGIRHLIVVDGDGTPVGIVSTGDLLKQRADEALSLGDKIEHAASAEELGRIWKELVNVASSLCDEDVGSTTIAEIISRELRALTQRACALAEEEMKSYGLGEPPVEYDLLVLGSGGRGESLLAMDQDNAFILAENPPTNAERWYAELGTRLSDMLDSVGLAYCKGGVMASNPEWRKDLNSWRRTVRSWIERADAGDILHSDIFFDAACVRGKGNLTRKLCEEATELAGKSRKFLRFLEMRASEVRPPFTLMGKIKTKSGSLDLKYYGLMPIFSAARALALRDGCKKRSTPSRLRWHVERNPDSGPVAENLIEAQRIMLRVILQQQLLNIDEGKPVGNEIDVRSLSSLNYGQLKWALEQVPNISVLLGVPTIS